MSAIQKRLGNMEIRFDESEVIVVDLGSGFIKAGYSGEDVPRVVIPTVVGTKDSHQFGEDSGAGGDSKPKHSVSRKIGHEAFLARSDPAYELHYPIERGVVRGEIQDWDHLTNLLDHVFTNELGIDPRSTTILMTDSLKSRKEHKQQLAQMMFDTFRFKAFALQNTAVLSLFSSGTTTGLVAESGEGVTYTVPVFEGYALPHAMQTIEVAGQDVTKKLLEELKEGNSPVRDEHYHYVRDIMEKMCHVPMHFNEELERRDDELT